MKYHSAIDTTKPVLPEDWSFAGRSATPDFRTGAAHAPRISRCKPGNNVRLLSASGYTSHKAEIPLGLGNEKPDGGRDQ